MTNKGDIILSFAAFFHIAVLIFQELLDKLNIISHEESRLICIFIASIPMLAASFYIVKRNLILLIVIYSSITILALLNLILFPENKVYLNQGLFNILFVNIPCLLCLASVKDIKILSKVLVGVSFCIFAIGLAYIILLWAGKMEFSGYSLTFSYYLLLPSLVFVSQRNIIYTFLFLIVCFFMFLVGSRGALFAAILYYFILILFDKNSRMRLIFAASILLIFILTQQLYKFLSIIIETTDISSRTLELLLSGNIGQDTGRFSDYKIVWEAVLQNPFWGHGLFGDRVLLNGIYSHNLFLEIFLNFGFFWGSIMIIIVLMAAIMSFNSSTFEYKRLLLMFFCYCIVPLMFSLSYLSFPHFYIFLGFILAHEIKCQRTEYLCF